MIFKANKGRERDSIQHWGNSLSRDTQGCMTCLASFENNEKCTMSNRPSGNVKVGSNEIGNIGWTINDKEFGLHLWEIWNHGRF